MHLCLAYKGRNPSSFLFQLSLCVVEDFWGGAQRDPHGSGIFRACSWEHWQEKVSRSSRGRCSVLAVSLLGQILRSFPKFSSTCSRFCDFMTLAELGELAADR